MHKSTVKKQVKNKNYKPEKDSNKGEKSELLVFVKLLHEQKIFLSDKDLNPKTDYFDIKKITTEKIDSDYFLTDKSLIEIVNKNTKEKKIINISKIADYKLINQIIDKIRKSTPTNKIPIPEYNEIKNNLNFKKSSSRNKSDILLDITKLIIKQNEGFGIKSYLGSNPTLLNASQSTNFIFEIQNLDKSKINDINSIDTENKIKDRIELIEFHGGIFKYIGPEKDTMKYNLKMVDSFMPEIIGHTLLTFYKNRISSISKIIDYIHQKGDLSKEFNYEDKNFLENKIKNLLIGSLLGFFPSKKWNGIYESNGTIIMKKSGDILAFHIMDLETLKNYLYDKTKLDTPDKRNKFGKIYFGKDEKLYINLNLQLRFK